MKRIRQQALEGKLLAGTFLNLGSSVTAEIAGRAGFDWVLIDLEHGSGDRQELLGQLMALEAYRAAPVVRIPWHDPPTYKRTLDLGASGIMVPYVSTPDEARSVVAAMQYPPLGARGVASINRACGFGQDFDEYFRQANDELLVIVQIETGEAVKNVDAIAAVDRVDVLFVGPLDLSVSLGVPRQFDHPDFREAVTRVVAASRRHGKAAGTLAANSEMLRRFVADGFTFTACGSDTGTVVTGFKDILSAFDQTR